MNLSKKSLWAKIYGFYFGNPLPNDLCSFFWKSVLGIVTTPLIIPGIWLHGIVRDENGWLKYLLRIVSSLITLVFLVLIIATIGFAISEPGQFAITFGLFLLIIGIIFGIEYLADSDNRMILLKKESVVMERIKGFKEGYCPRIEWKND